MSFTPQALIPDGWGSDVRVTIDGGAIEAVETGAAAQDGDERHALMAQRWRICTATPSSARMAGLAESAGQGDDTSGPGARPCIASR